MALTSLNHTQLSNEFIDKYMLHLSGNAVKIFLAITRKTVGWHKDIDRISNNQLMQQTGIKHRKTLQTAIQELVDYDLINVIRIGKGKNIKTYYEIKYCSKNEHQEEQSENNGSKIDPLNQLNGSKIDPIEANNGSKIDPTKENIINKNNINKEDVAIDNQLQPSHIDNKTSFDKIRKKFKEYNADYYHDGKQSKFIKLLLQRCDNDYQKVIDFLDKLIKIKTESKKEFWKSAPVTPQGLYSRLDYMMEMEKEYTTTEQEQVRSLIKNIFKGGAK